MVKIKKNSRGIAGYPTTPEDRVMSIYVTKNSPTPLYYQIQKQLKQKILDGEYAPNDRLPSERELSEELRVTRVTIRRAIRALVAEGYCVKREGEGIFVAPEKYAIDLQGFNGFSDYARRLGVTPKTVVLEARVENSGGHVAEKLAIAPGDPVLYIKRVRYLETLPVILEATWLPLKRWTGLEKHQFTESLYSILRHEYGIVACRGQGTLNIAVATEEHANHLGVPLSSPLMFKKATVFTEDGVLVEYVHMYYRVDVFEFRFESHKEQ